MLERPFADDEEASDRVARSDGEDPDYAFEGFTVEFSEKIALTPPVAAPSADERGGLGR